jgi:drug/metabolite transporter (DMT)-like permease
MGEFLALLTALLWAVGVILFKRSIGFVTPFSLSLFKNCVAFLLLALTAILLEQTHIFAAPPGDLLIMLVSGAIGIGISDTLLFMALSRLGASRTALVDCLYSPFVIFFSVVILKETLSSAAVVGGVLIIGSVIVSSQRGFGGSISRRQLWIGCALGVSAMATVAFAVILVQPLLTVYPLASLSALRMAGGIALLLVVLPVHSDRKSVYAAFRPQPAWRWMLSGTFVGSYLSLMCWLAGFKYAKAGVAALLNQTSTVLIVLLAAAFLKEPLTRLKLLAVTMAFAGAALVLS